MDYKNYITQCIERDDRNELLLSWHFLGEQKATKDTRFYRKGNLYQIKDPVAPFNNTLFYCDEDYNGAIDWSTIKKIDAAQQTTIKSGITATCFTFYNTIVIEDSDLPLLLQEIEADDSYAPFTKYFEDVSNDILIDDDQYYQIMQVVGQPYVHSKELEYNRQAILKLAVEPALKMYYTYFPLIQEEVRPVTMGGDYLIKYPTEPYPAYKAIAWTTSPGLARGSLNGLSPLAALGTEISMYTRSAAGSKFAQGLRYNKPVPGFTGERSTRSMYNEMSTAWPLATTLKQMNRREKLSKVHLEDGIYAKGYSTLTGYLNITWLCWSRNFDDVEFEDFPEVLRLCQSFVKVSIGSIRALLKEDSNLPFDAKEMRREGLEEINSKEKEWKESPYNKIFTTQRGGMI